MFWAGRGTSTCEARELTVTAEARFPGSVRFLEDPYMRIAGVCLLLVAIPYVVPVFSPNAQLEYGDLYATLPFHLLTFLAAVVAGRRQTVAAARRFWFFVAAASACWIGEKVLGMALGVGFLESPAGLVNDLLFVSFYLFFALAIEQEPHRGARPERLMRLRRVGAAVSVFCLLVYFAVLPAALNVEAYVSWLPSMLLFLLLDVYVLARFILLSRSEGAGAWRGIYLLLAMTAALWLMTDILEAFAVAGAIQLPPPGHPIDAVFFPKFFTLIAAARMGARTDAGAYRPVEDAFEPPPSEQWAGPLVASLVALPVLHFGLYSLGWLDETTRAAREAWVAFSVVLLATGGIVYHRRLVKENQRLWSRSQTAIRRLQESERLEAIGRLAGGIAHEFNNLLTVVMGNTELARASMARENSEARRHLDDVVGAADRGAKLVRKLLGFGRRDVLSSEPTDLAAFVRRLSDEWSRVMPENVTIHFHGSPDTPSVLLDASVFESVVVNLLTNARDSMPQGGRIDIETHTEVVTAEEASGEAAEGTYGCLEVRDVGVGMDCETLARVFEPFFTTKPVGEGAGMGLAMVFGIVKQHNGLIRVESAPARGTSVVICLPACNAPTPATGMESPVQPTAAPSGTKTILLVEDKPEVRVVAADLLGSCGFTVIQARDGVEALEIFEEEKGAIDLIVSDLLMPHMGGLELYERVRAVPSTVPFVFLSGHAPEVDRRSDLHQAVPFVAKPWRSEELLAGVRQALDTAPLEPRD